MRYLSTTEAGKCLVGPTDGEWSALPLKSRVGPTVRRTALPDDEGLTSSKPDYFWGSPWPQLTTFLAPDLFVLQGSYLRDVDWTYLSSDFGL